MADVSRQLEKTYEPKQVEERWYKFWTEQRYFHASLDHPGRPYAIVIPPPNVTGSLHIGHALNNSLQDILIRWRRMQGRNTLWLPGTDHAGIATQNVVEQQLRAEGISREALGRQKFIQRVWEWKARSGETIIQQLKRLGASCDWDRLRFTMDEGLSKAVREVFVRLYQEGLIYRGERLINWCPRCLTALSDIEVEHEETRGKLYYINYPLTHDPGTSLTVATTRPETMLADTAVAVHPDDPRYNRLIGRKIALPLTRRNLPVIGDPVLVDRELGTGAVKVTPGHDFNDFEAGNRHALPRLALFDREARIAPAALREAAVDHAVQARLAHKSSEQARAVVVELLRERGVLAKIEDHKTALGKCYRCKTVVEPYLSPQWFVKIKPLAEPAIQAVEDGRIRLIPEGWVNNYLGWMRDIKDWCISRQIWWGHQVPAWYCIPCGRDNGTLIETGLEGMAPAPRGASRKPAKSVIITHEAKPLVSRSAPAHCPDCSASEFIRDPDVLDTWFSSALWPFSTLGWPEQTPELKTFYPTSTLVTGLDILFFWVARMIMMGLKFMGDVPFRDVYIHALVRDIEGQKMSKSKGNVIDPLSVMEQYGTDALRFTLAAMAAPGRDIKLAEERIEGYRNFANKLWNAARFILMHLYDGSSKDLKERPRKHVPLRERMHVDRWIVSRLNRCIADVTQALESYRFDEAANQLYHFIWHEYCDWYLELIKPVFVNTESGSVDDRARQTTRHTLAETFETLVRLLHPFMPFITEEIWQTLPHTGPSLMVATYPTPSPSEIDDEMEQEIGSVKEVVSAIRSLRTEKKLAPSKHVAIWVIPRSDEIQRRLSPYGDRIRALARISMLHMGPGFTPPRRSFVAVCNAAGVYLPWEGNVDILQDRRRLEKQLSEVEAQLAQIEKKVTNPDFLAHVPLDVLEKTRTKHAEMSAERDKLAMELDRLREIMEEARER